MKQFFVRLFILVFIVFILVNCFEALVEVGDERSAEDRALKKELAEFEGKKGVAQKVKVVEPEVQAQKAVVKRRVPVELLQRPLTSSLNRKVKGVRSGIVYDSTNRKIFWQKSMEKAVPIASMTKMMTCLLTVEKIQRGQLNLKQKYKVTPTCTRAKPSKVWLDTREVTDLESLCRAMMIKSANDAAHLISEIVAGDAKKFVDMMNLRAKQIGLNSLYFYNANGLPEGRTRKVNIGSAKHLAFLAERLLRYPNAVRWASTKTDKFITSFRQRTGQGAYSLVNHNKLLWKFPGVNGMKTGFINESGFCSTVTCQKEGRTLIVVVTGLDNARNRDNLIAELLEWGFEQKPNL